jgi:hypothetical protein
MAAGLVRWDAEADVLAAAWVDGAVGQALQHARIERDGDRSYVRGRWGGREWARTEIPSSMWLAEESASLRITDADEWWRLLERNERHTRPDERRRHEAAAAAVLWTAKPRDCSVSDRLAVDFTLERRGTDTVVSFVDEWAGQRELIEFPVWLDQPGGVDAETLGNFWLGLAEGIVRGRPLP